MSCATEALPTCDEHLTGKDFEALIVPRLERYRMDRIGSFNRPGVHATTSQRFDDGTVRARLIQSLPDFQGVFGRPQREAVFDAKVCSQASFNLAKYRKESRGARQRQLQFMYERDAFGSVCFFLIHWNDRELQTRTVPAVTYAFPVSYDHPFWETFERGSEKAIKRKHCEEYAIEVPWITMGQERTLRPDLMFAIGKFAMKRQSRRVSGRW